MDVKSNPAFMKEMLSVSDGRRSVPVIVDGGQVTVGYGGS
jgi:glutaredoxin